MTEGSRALRIQLVIGFMCVALVVYFLMLGYCLLFFPTIGLTNSLTLRQLTDAGSEFPFIRMFATIGWIAVGWTISQLKVEAAATQFMVACGASIVMGLYCLTLPHTPPMGKGKKITVGSLVGLDALVMLKNRPYLIFVISSVLACIPLTFYFSFANRYLKQAMELDRSYRPAQSLFLTLTLERAYDGKLDQLLTGKTSPSLDQLLLKSCSLSWFGITWISQSHA